MPELYGGDYPWLGESHDDLAGGVAFFLVADRFADASERGSGDR